MTLRRVVFIGEGVTDNAVVPILTRKVLARELGQEPALEEYRGRLGHLRKKRGMVAKTELAILEAHRQGFDGVSLVVDRDRQRERLALVREGRRAAASQVPLPAAVGVAVETLEAWLLADEQAIRRALELDPPPPPGPDPESLDGQPGTARHPQVRLAHLLGQDGIETRSNQARFQAIATEADAAVVERRCPSGFGGYAEEVRHRLAPMFR